MPDIHSQSCSPCVSSTSTSTLEKNSIGPRPLNHMRSSEFYCAVDSLRNQGRAFTANGVPPAQIKPKYDYSDVYNLNSLFKGQ